jgi:hypothetical protein
MKFLLLTAFLFFIKTSFASHLAQPVLSDTTKPEKEYKLNRDQFLEKYGKDDSSRALINYYFSRRTSAKILFFINVWQIPFWPFPFSYNLKTAESNSSTIGQSLGAFIISLIFLCLLFASFGLATAGSAEWLKHSRKRLLKQLNNYFNGRPMPRAIIRSRLFRRFLEDGKK